MKIKPFVLVGGAALVLAGTASADFLGIKCEEYDGGADAQAWLDNGYAGLVTYRLYANFTPGDSNGVAAVFGIRDIPLSLNSDTGTFYNDAIFGGMTAPNDLRVAGIWSAEWDTYVTVGVSHNDGSPTSLSPGFATLTGGLGQNWSTENGGWFVTPDDPNSVPDANGKHLLAQVTVDEGVGINGIISIQLRDGTQFESMTFATPAPGALALLGLAGVVGTRRRRA